MAFSLDSYIDVAERINLFYEAHPNGRLTTVDMRLMDTQAGQFLFVHAQAHRDPEDGFPGDGFAWEPLPGKTPYTKDSELMNAQTAAWGRAIVAVGILASKKIASKQEVQARQANGHVQASEPVTEPPVAPERYVDWLRLAIRAKNPSEAYPDEVSWVAKVESASSKNAKRALVEELEALAVDVGLDPRLILERWESSRAGAA